MKKWTMRISLFLLLGVVTTVGVAWGLAQVDVFSDYSRDSDQIELLEPQVLEAEWRRVVPAEWKSVVPDSGKLERVGLGRDYLWLYIDVGDFSRFPHLLEHRFGLPNRAMSFTEWGTLNWTHEADVLDLDWSLVPGSLPLGPLFPGFVINTLFYATIWFALLFGPGTFKRWNRKRRGLCPMCKYDLRVQVAANSQEPQANSSIYCPECGWGREAFTAESPPERARSEDSSSIEEQQA